MLPSMGEIILLLPEGMVKSDSGAIVRMTGSNSSFHFYIYGTKRGHVKNVISEEQLMKITTKICYCLLTYCFK